MATAHRVWLLLPRQLRALPADLAAVVLSVVLTNLVVLAPVVNDTPLRIVLGLPFVLFVPGYAFIAALFPEAATQPGDDGDEGGDASGADERNGATDADTSRLVPTRGGGIDGIERVALSFGLSIAVVPLIGLMLNFTPWGIRLTPIMVALTAFVLGATVAAADRRWELPEDERFRVPYRRWFVVGRAELLEPESRTDAALNVLLVLSVLLAVSSVAYAVAVPNQGESFTEFYLLTEDEDSDLVADDYPTEFSVGENRSLVVGVTNQEHEPTEYSVLVQLQRVRTANNSTRVLASERLRQFEVRLADNETWHQRHTIRPTMTGQRLRLAYLLYRGAPPESPSVESAYRTTHLWINVTSDQ
ncbi:DUF1616 domain-containing protein [Halorientalis sp.]|uniref:DUF1616 domain-containing protein n=1 Tax=Halorientalis sp. TaxID=1931229 RepID=UPI00260992F3|nr:DUF1616 domain-containing protein [Halorientalis sp.]